jgi:hypothetical protein
VKLQGRARDGVKLLLNLDDAQVPVLAKKFAQTDDLANVELERRDAPDAG